MVRQKLPKPGPVKKPSPGQGVNPELLRQLDRELADHRREWTGETDELPRTSMTEAEAQARIARLLQSGTKLGAEGEAEDEAGDVARRAQKYRGYQNSPSRAAATSKAVVSPELRKAMERLAEHQASQETS